MWSSAGNLDHKSLLREVLEKARRRCVAHLLLDQSALALTIGMGGAVVLLLAGTQILDWYWVVLLAVGSLGVGVYRLRQTIPSIYRLAQRIDRRLALADSLSTAIYFEGDPSRGHEAIRVRQRQEAESIARSVNLTVALPLRRPRFAYPAIALTAVAFGLFAVRYAVTGSLSLQPSLVKMAFDNFFPPAQQMAKADKKRDPLKPPSVNDTNPDSPTVQNEQSPDQMLNAPDAPDSPDSPNPDAADNSKQAAQPGRQDEQNADPQGDQEKGDKQSNGNDSNDENSKQGNKDGKQQQSAKEGKQASENQSSSLMDKLKDAMSNMLNKMKQASKDGQQSQQQDAQNSQQNGQKDKSNQSKQGKQQDQAKSDSQSDQQSDAGDKKQTADAKGSEKSSDKNASQDSKSGIGSADGDKSAKEAEQLAAMGKISEILGKRAQNVTGEVMIEVGSSKQQLKTPWAQKQAAHAEAGSEIHRDEVPLIYQQFVEQYFEEIRKAPAAPKTAKPAAQKN